MTTKKAKDLALGDVVQLSDGPYSCATVKKVGEDEVTFFRPYVQTADFSYTGGVPCYIGIEEFSVYRGDSEFDVLQLGKIEAKF
jgi:hypothetical protein